MTDANDRAFPRELLKCSFDQKVWYFHAKTIEHPSIRTAMEQLLHAIEDALPGSLIFIYGPSGVRKSTLLRRAEAKIVKRLLPQLEIDREMVPVVNTQLAVHGSRGFIWSDTYRRLLERLNEPLIEHKVTPRSKLEEHGISVLNKSEDKYRLSYEIALSHRRPAVVMLDDAHHLNKVGAARLLNQLDCIKTIAGQTKVPHALCGTYELLTLRNLSGQMARRSKDIHFGRYKFDEAGQEGFGLAVKTFQAHMPMWEHPDLLCHLDYLMERSCGCVGLLKDWCQRALVNALRHDAPTVDIKHFEQTTYSDDMLARICTEIAEGEERLQTGGNQYYLQSKRLREADRKKSATVPATPGKKEQPAKPASKNIPGQRKAARDPIADPALSPAMA